MNTEVSTRRRGPRQESPGRPAGRPAGTSLAGPAWPARPEPVRAPGRERARPGRPAGRAQPGRESAGPPRARPRPARGRPRRRHPRPRGTSREPGSSCSCSGMLGGGLVCLLVINTTLAAASFRINALQRGNAALAQQEQTLQQQVSTEESPASLRAAGAAAGPADATAAERHQPAHRPRLPAAGHPAGHSQCPWIRSVTARDRDRSGDGGTRPRSAGRPGTAAGPAKPGPLARAGRGAGARATGARTAPGGYQVRPGPACRGPEHSARGPRPGVPRPGMPPPGAQRPGQRAGSPAAGRGAIRWAGSAARARASAGGVAARSRRARAAAGDRVPRFRRVLRRGSPARRLNVTLICIVFALSLFAGRLVQLQGLDWSTLPAAGRAAAAHHDPDPGGARNHHDQRRQGAGHDRADRPGLRRPGADCRRRSGRPVAAALAGPLAMPPARILQLINAARPVAGLRRAEGRRPRGDRQPHHQPRPARHRREAELQPRLPQRRPRRQPARLHRHERQDRRAVRRGRR